MIYWLKQLESPEVALASSPDKQALEPYCEDLSLQLSLSPSLVSAFPWVSFLPRRALWVSWPPISQLDSPLRKKTAPLQSQDDIQSPRACSHWPVLYHMSITQPIAASRRVGIC